MKCFALLASTVAVLMAARSDLAAQSKVKQAEMFARVLKTSKDPEKRLDAARELASLGKVKESYIRPYTPVLIDAFKGDSDSAVRVAAGSALLVFEADPALVVPAVLDIIRKDKEPGAVRAVAARLAAVHQVKDAIPALEALKKGEEAKDDPKTRDQRLLQAVNQALQVLSK